ncbi:MAG: aspartate carbamoyltransferase regulatory subunit [Bacteroidales bacterium]|nr:aspartate carbamoyltransferase regulatory subunit [Bacteroidales bacterium]MDD2611233.1 aspartate carbamoyltransferase regulatory subunit [Bacteroidales bacterium]MDD3907650.1 aspartate carbamoyltransferase regulatory subunit [Bacteroidales bacterium]MDD4711975.1 aspartate carbamoyltransferase regulatory subunit [Bacteroidales bacterium]
MIMENNEKELQVKALKNGTVIDHIPSDILFKVVSLLQLDSVKNQITIGNNLTSKRMGKKGIIKISDRYYEEEEISRIALIAPDAKINIIRNFEVIEKKVLSLPDSFTGIVKCPNPKCITNNEPMKTKFEVIKKNPVVLRCPYCEREIQQEDIQLL